MKHMSFALTERQLLTGHKTVTRRLHWWSLKPGDQLLAVQKCMGLKKGQKQKRLAVIRVKNTRSEALENVTEQEARLEGFPHMTGGEFIAFFCKAMKCTPGTVVNRIEFEVLETFEKGTPP